MTGKGDVISCDYSTIQSVYIPKASASLRVQTHGEIHSVAWSDLAAVLTAYPSFREEFINQLELAYNLGHEEEVSELYNIQSRFVQMSLETQLSKLIEGGVRGIRKPQIRTEIRQKNANRIGFCPEY